MDKDSKIYSDIFGIVRTTDEAQELFVEFDRVMDAVTRLGQTTIADVLSHTIRKKTADAMVRIAEKTGISLSDGESLRKLIMSLTALVKNARIMKLTIAFDPTDTAIERFFYFIVETYQEYVLLDIQKDPAIGGGAIVEFNGTYRDLSMSRKIETMFLEKREKILSFLR